MPLLHSVVLTCQQPLLCIKQQVPGSISEKQHTGLSSHWAHTSGRTLTKLAILLCDLLLCCATALDDRGLLLPVQERLQDCRV